MDKELLESGKLLVIPLGLFFLSLFLVPFEENHGNTVGWELLSLGYLGIFYGHFHWLANPLFFLAMVCWHLPKFAILLLIIAFALITDFVLTDSFNYGWGILEPKRFLFGFYLWLSAFTLLLAIHILRIIYDYQHTKSDH